MPTAKRKEPPTPAAVAPTTIDEDELDRILASADLDAMERSATQASSSSQPPTQSAVPSPVKSPATRKRVMSSPKGEAREAHRGGDEENDLSEDEGDFEAASPSKPVTMKQQTLRPTALPEPTSIYSREERRQAKLRKFARENEARYAWLESPKDEAGRSPSDPNYDPSTLYIPAPAQRSFTPFEQQYWDIKKKHFDTVVFFRKGKFYELFELDADVGHRVLGLRLSERTHMRMVGLPADTFDLWAGKLIAQGYKITKVEQVEDHAAAEQRKNKQGIRAKGEEVIQRKVTQILTCGTVADEALLSDYRTAYLLCLGYIEGGDLGVCLLDSAMRTFQIGAIPTDGDCAALKALLLKFSPREVLYERGRLPAVAAALLRNHDAPITVLPSFISAQESFAVFGRCQAQPPPLLRNASPQVLSAFGGVVSYLERLHTLDETIKGANFVSLTELSDNAVYIDGVTFQHLEVFETAVERRTDGTLFRLMDHCETPAGRRLLRTWIQHPLRKVDAINDRLDAIEYFQANSDFSQRIGDVFRSLPDLPRLTSRATASKLPLLPFLRLLDAYESLAVLYEGLYRDLSPPKAKCLLRITMVGETLPDLRVLLGKFSFDRKKAATDGGITPAAGEDEQFDEAANRVEEAYARIQAFVEKQQEELRNTAICVVEVRNKQKYAIEAPAALVVPRTWVLLNSHTKAKRYDVPEMTPMLAELKAAEEALELQRSLVLSRYLARFTSDSVQWYSAATAAAELDALRSLAVFSVGAVGAFSRPQVENSEKPFLEFTAMHHPCLAVNNANFIPNDLALGTQANPSTALLLTGPNMGGKSTLLRQVCVVVLLAHIGCFVPAEHARMSLTDRIYTRIGAYDRLLQGQSTFMVELTETSGILHGATMNSLVVLDELGRGTSTFDGYAVAYAVLRHLAYVTGCRTLFSTHYHLLTAEFAADSRVCLYHMACKLIGSEVIFQYRLQKGACPKSYGMNVALMAGLPREVVSKAEEKARKFEDETPLLSGNFLLAPPDRLVTQVLIAEGQQRLLYLQGIIHQRSATTTTTMTSSTNT